MDLRIDKTNPYREKEDTVHSAVVLIIEGGIRIERNLMMRHRGI